MNKFQPLASLVVLAVISHLQLAQAQENNIERLQKDVDILEKVLEVNLGDGHRSDISVNGVFLARQGILLRIDSGSQFRHRWPTEWFEEVYEVQVQAMAEASETMAEFFSETEFYSDADTPVMPAAPVAPLPPKPRSRHLGQGDDEMLEWQNKYREQMNKLRDQERSLNEQHRQYQRQLLEASRKDDYKAMEEARKKLTEANRQVMGVDDEIRLQTEKLQAQIKAKDAETLQKLLLASTATLCDYAGSLRNLDDNNYITMIFEGGHYRERKAEILVISKKQLAQCQRGSLTPAKLLSEATQYRF